MLAPFHETLYAHVHLGELNRFQLLTRDAEGLQAAKRTAIAFHEPKGLAEERTNLMDRIGALPDSAEAMARGLTMIEEMNRVDARRAEAENVVDQA